nr:RNA polymerase sigma-70 factor [Parabacteroides acidifaciens]
MDDEDAFRSLFFKFFSSLCVFAHRYIEQWETCEDIVQDTFFKIWKNRKKMIINTSGRNLLLTSVRNSCVDYLRKQEIETSWIQKKSLHKTEYSTDDLYATVELENMLNAALSNLPENIRQVFEMSRFEGLTYTEIATQQRISIKTVEAYITKALKQLRIELKDYLPLALLLF